MANSPTVIEQEGEEKGWEEDSLGTVDGHVVAARACFDDSRHGG